MAMARDRIFNRSPGGAARPKLSTTTTLAGKRADSPPFFNENTTSRRWWRYTSKSRYTFANSQQTKCRTQQVNQERDLLRAFLPLLPLFSRDGDLLFRRRSSRFAEGDLLRLRWRLESRFLLLSRSRLPLSSSLPSLAFPLLLLLPLLFLSRSVFPARFLSGAFISEEFFLLAAALLVLPRAGLLLSPCSRLPAAPFLTLEPPSLPGPASSPRPFALLPLVSLARPGEILASFSVTFALLLALLLPPLPERLPSLPLSCFLSSLFPFPSLLGLTSSLDFFDAAPRLCSFLFREERSRERSRERSLLLLAALLPSRLPRSEPLPPLPPPPDPLRLLVGLREGLRLFSLRLLPLIFLSRLRLALRLLRLLRRSGLRLELGLLLLLLVRSLLLSRLPPLPLAPLEPLRL